MNLSSDHRLVIANINLKSIYPIWNKLVNKQNSKKERLNIDQLKEAKEQYQQNIEEKLFKLDPTEINWKNISDILKKATKDTVGTMDKTSKGNTYDQNIQELSKKQKELRNKIRSSKNTNNIKEWKNQRNQIQLEIRRKCKERYEKEIEDQLKDIEEVREDKQMYRAMKELLKNKQQRTYLTNEENKEILNEEEAGNLAKSHFQEKFLKEEMEKISRNETKRLSRPITFIETKEAIKKLNNGRAAGEDGIVAEMLKYAGDHIIGEITKILNAIIEGQTEESNRMGKGILILLQKPGKAKGILGNLRPITLLNTIRKTLSSIALKRIRPKIEEFLSSSQAGFRKGRSTTDVIWTHKWKIARSITYQAEEYCILGIDLSQAFDTINRKKLMEILKGILDEDEYNIISVLLKETTLEIQWNGKCIGDYFETNIGTPQGDSLSPVLFIIYLEAAIQDFFKELNNEIDKDHNYAKKNENKGQKTSYVSYADDTDFFGKDMKQLRDMEKIMESSFKKWNLKMNLDKTELVKVGKNEEDWKKSKKLGTLLGDEEEIKRRKQLSQLAMSKLWKIWLKGKKVKIPTRVRLYNAYIKPILTYNASTWAITKQQEESLNAFHRKQMRRMMNIHYPNRISNKKVYEKTGTRPIAVDITRARWKMLGHCLRMQNTPAYNEMKTYFDFQEEDGRKKFAGRPKSNIYTTIKKDIKLAHIKNLESKEDFYRLQSLASDRDLWRKLVSQVTQEKLKKTTQ